MDRLGSFLAEKSPQRFLCIVLFAALLFAFRHLAPVLIFFVTFERAIGFLARHLAARTRWTEKKCVLVVVAAGFVLTGVAIGLGVGRGIHAFARMHETFPEKLAQMKENPVFEKIREQIGDTERIVERAQHYAGSAFAMAAAFGHFVVHATIGFILALVFRLEHHEVDTFYASVPPKSIEGTLLRWVGHVADATIVTVQLQFIVAAFNTVLTLPVLLVLGIPHVGALMVLIFVSALIPVIGNFVSGVVLCVMAYQARGPVGVGVFIALTAILHKVESYYLNPRLTSRHVHLPGFVLIVSLVLWEHLIGFAGLFVSFPFLFVAGRIRAEQREPAQLV